MLVGSYLCGSLATAIWTGKVLRGIDIRDHGSGNAGATNVYRVLGWKAALLVVLVDVSKGLIPTLLAANVAADMEAEQRVWFQIAAGICAIAGHVWTLFAGFRGGKGVGTAAGVLLALFPLAVPLCILVFALIVWRTGYVSLASIFAVASLPVIIAVLEFGLDRPVARALWILALAMVPFIVFTHRSNIRRLWRGEEHRFTRSR